VERYNQEVLFAGFELLVNAGHDRFYTAWQHQFLYTVAGNVEISEVDKT
jgi:hypothetical protein